MTTPLPQEQSGPLVPGFITRFAELVFAILTGTISQRKIDQAFFPAQAWQMRLAIPHLKSKALVRNNLTFCYIATDIVELVLTFWHGPRLRAIAFRLIHRENLWRCDQFLITP